MRKCKTCKELKSDEYFVRKSNRCKSCQNVLSKEHYLKNKSKYLANNAARKNIRKEFVNEYKKTHPCIQCGESDFRCLDFHHRDPTTKIDCIARMVLTGLLELIKKEIPKCDVLCANCHRKLHYDEFNAI